MITSENPFLIVVSGGSCSGKSYLAGVLAEAINLFMKVSCVGLDNYYKDIDDPSFPRDANGRRLFDKMDSYHCNQFVRDVLDLMAGKNISIPVYDQVLGKRAIGQYTVKKSADIIIAEGLFAMTILENVKNNKINIYVDASEEIRLERRIARDIFRHGVPRNMVINNFFEKVKPCHLEFVDPQKCRADIILINNQKGGESNGRRRT